MRHRSWIGVILSLAFGLEAQEECTRPEGRKVTDLVDPQGGANDIDGTGRFNISDMVYGLNFLFAGGPPPCPLILAEDICSGRLCPGPLPATGQTSCCGEGNACTLECDDPAVVPGQDAAYEAGCSSRPGRFVDNGDGTVTDTCTGLQWQRDTPMDLFTWEEALRESEDLVLAGHDDWRLPNVRELQSIVDHGRVSPSIATEFVPSTFREWYWSSTTRTYSPDQAWEVYFGDGNVNVDAKQGLRRFRAVRSVESCRGRLPATGQTWCYAPNHLPADCGTAAIPGQDGAYGAGQPHAGRFVDNGDGTVTDNATGLTWQKAPADTNWNGAADGGDVLAWQAALGFCESLITTKGGSVSRWASDEDLVLGAIQPSDVLHDDWRLPNIRELMSIVDYGRADPAIDTAFFTGWPSSTWTSTSHAVTADNAWHVSAESGTGGTVMNMRKIAPLAVRAVRGGLGSP
jgi:hypothetical protein